METELQRIRKEKIEVEKLRSEVMDEIHQDVIKLSEKNEEIGGYRDVKIWEGSLQDDLKQRDLVNQEILIKSAMAHKQKQLEGEIVEKDEKYVDNLKPKFILINDIETLNLQLIHIDIQRTVLNKHIELRELKKNQDAALIEKYSKKE